MASRHQPQHTHSHLSVPSTAQLLTQVLPALVLVDVDVDFFDCQDSSCEWCLIRVTLRGGTQQLHQQQRVPHHPLHWLDEEGAQVNVVRATPGKSGQRRCMRCQSSSATHILPPKTSANQIQNSNASKLTVLPKSSHPNVQIHCIPELLVLSDEPQVSAPHSQQVILPSQDPLHYQTHHEIPHRHGLTLAREPLPSDAVPPTSCPDLSPSAGQTDCRTAVTAGLSWLLGAEISQTLFPAQDLPSPHHLCCLPVQPTHCLCCNHATDTLSSQSSIHKALLGHPGMHPACARRLVTREWPDQHRQTSRD